MFNWKGFEYEKLLNVLVNCRKNKGVNCIRFLFIRNVFICWVWVSWDIWCKLFDDLRGYYCFWSILVCWSEDGVWCLCIW